MESSEKDVVTDVPLKVVKPFTFLNILTLSLWNRFTPRERSIAFASWNLSSWVTVAQIVFGKMIWTKVSPWLVPAAKSVWGKVTVSLLALKEVVV